MTKATEWTQEQSDEYRKQAAENYDDDSLSSTPQEDVQVEEHQEEVSGENVDFDKGEEETRQNPDDKFTDLQKLMESMNNKLSTFDAIESRLRKTESKMGNVHSGLKEIREHFETEKNKPSQEQMAEADLTSNSIKELGEVYPGVDKKLKSLEERIKNQVDNIKPQPGINEDEIVSRIAQQVRATTQQETLASRFPNYKTETASPEYWDWMDKQPHEMYRKSQTGVAGDAIEVLEAFTRRNDKPEGTSTETSADEIIRRREERLKRSTQHLSAGVTTRKKAEDDMSEQEYRDDAARRYKEL